MIGHIEGTILAKDDKRILVDVHGVGYWVTISDKMKSIIQDIGALVKVFTHVISNQRDGSTELFGFINLDDLRFFELLTTVSGIGPRSAQTILSSADINSLCIGIMKEDFDLLSKISGIGPKTAKRLVLELKSKVAMLPLSAQAGDDFNRDIEAADALVSLGYSRFEANDAIKAIGESSLSTEELLSQALKILGKKNRAQ